MEQIPDSKTPSTEVVNHPGELPLQPPKQEAFCQEYTRNAGNAAAAYRCAYDVENMLPQTVWKEGWEVTKLHQVATRIEFLQLQLARDEKFITERILREEMLAAFVDPGDFFDDDGEMIPIKQLPERARRALAGWEVVEAYAKGGDKLVKHKFRLEDKGKAKERISRMFGLYEADNRQQNPGAALGDLLEKMDGATRGLPKRANKEANSPKLSDPVKQPIDAEYNTVKCDKS